MGFSLFKLCDYLGLITFLFYPVFKNSFLKSRFICCNKCCCVSPVFLPFLLNCLKYLCKFF